jgi:hypothetical protein
MNDVIVVLLERIISDPILRNGLEEACRSGRVVAMGKRVRHIEKQSEPGQLSFTEVVEEKLENIPPDDWTDTSLFRIRNEFRLEGWEKWESTDRLYIPKIWPSVWFRERDLRALLERALEGRPATLGRRPALRNTVEEYLVRQYPGGKPADRSYEAIHAEIKEKVGVAVSVRTIARIFNKK